MTAGFLGKFYVLGAGVEQRQWLLLGAIVAGSAVGLYFYLRAMIQLYLRPTSAPVRADAPTSPPAAAASRASAAFPGLLWARGAGGGMLIVLALLMLALGLYPTPFVELAHGAAIESQPSTPSLTVDRR